MFSYQLQKYLVVQAFPVGNCENISEVIYKKKIKVLDLTHKDENCFPFCASRKELKQYILKYNIYYTFCIIKNMRLLVTRPWFMTVMEPAHYKLMSWQLLNECDCLIYNPIPVLPNAIVKTNAWVVKQTMGCLRGPKEAFGHLVQALSRACKASPIPRHPVFCFLSLGVHLGLGLASHPTGPHTFFHTCLGKKGRPFHC